jgi:ribA/ribD-fused uncharacterized protein
VTEFTQRGFAVFLEIEDDYGADVAVVESSDTEGHVWIQIDGGQITSNKGSTLLSPEQARRVARALLDGAQYVETSDQDPEPDPEPIDSFKDDDTAFLSNFWPQPFVYDGVLYPTSEHAFQAQKTLDPAQRKIVASATSPGIAKRLGRTIALRPDWEAVKLDVMYEVLRAKFSDPDLAKRLLATGNAELIEGNWWGDRFWGIYLGEGENHLGKILMRIRDELRS